MPGPEVLGEDTSLHRKLVWLTLFRILLVTSLLGGTAALGWRHVAGGAATGSPLYGLVLATYLASLASAWWLRHGGRLLLLAYLQIGFDVATASAVVAVTGRAESVFVFMFSLAIVNGSILVGRRGAGAALVLSLLAYSGLHAAVAPRLSEVPWALVLVHAGAFVATSALAGYLAEQLRRTGERLAERESDLATITALHESIVQSVTSGLLTVDAGGRITFLNRAGEQMVGLTHAEVVGRPARPRFEAILTDTARAETTWQAGPGRRLQLGYSTFPLRSRDGLHLGKAVIFQDLTELRSMEERVARSERLADLGGVAAGLAHELRNPLASMMGSVEILRQSPGMATEDRRLTEIMLREAERLDQLVAQFLAFARPAEPQRAPVDLAAVAGDTLAVFAHDPCAAGIELAPALRPARTVGDPDQIRQVLWNLLRNAAQATAAPAASGRVVRVTTDSDADGAALLVVEDTGPGIGPEDRERIFLPFFTTRHHGTGLGLATVQRIVDAHGGTVTLESEVGAGTRFTVRLPGPRAQGG